MPPKTDAEAKLSASMTAERWRQVDAVVRDALAQPPEARAAFVSGACRGDASLRREVEELLAVRSGDFLARPAAVAFAAAEDAAMYTHVSAALAGRYVLEREVGRGGMATVYLARDLRHDRFVAVKVLHAELAAVVGGARFLAEIRTTAALQHPHILPLFDSGSADRDRGLLYYVMPFVEGETLRARLAREVQLPVADAVRIATEVASALEYAHRHGVIHRDIKPENILLNEDGQALVADFGIALAITNAAGERLTQSGLSLGTPQYMAPEQAAGERSIDARVDIYALGAVTYEMLAGEPPFTGPSAQAIIARVMTESPRELAARRPSVPRHVDTAVRTALEKVQADRFASASAFAGALITPQPALGGTLAAALPRRWSPRLAGLTTVGLAIVAALGSAVGWRAGLSSARARDPANASVRFFIQVDSGFLEFQSDPAISPDGRTVVYAADGPEGTLLYARPIGQLAARPLPSTRDGRKPFFSPNGEWVGYTSHGLLWKTRLDGGTPVAVESVATAHSDRCSWDDDETILCGAGPGLVRIPAGGGTVSRIRVADTTVDVLDPHPLPGGKALLVTVAGGALIAQTRVGVLDLATGRVRVFGDGQGARYVGGAVVYASTDGELRWLPFDLHRLEPTGSTVVVTKDLETFFIGRSGFDVSETGALVYCPAISGLKHPLTLTLTDRAGHQQRVIPAHFPWAPRFSPDGHRIAFGAKTLEQKNGDVWISDIVAGTTERLTTDDRDGNDAQWSPDGRMVAYSAYVPTEKEKHLVVRQLDGGAERALTRVPGTQWPSDWTPDGRKLLFTRHRDSVSAAGELVTVDEIWVAPLDDAPPRPYLTSSARQRGARISSDGKWVAYFSNETGRDEVYVQSYPNPGLKLLVSDGAGNNPLWRRNSRELYYWHADTLVAVTFEAPGVDQPLKVRGRTPLFHAPYAQGDHPNYDVSPDGSQFVMVTGFTRANRLVVELNALGHEPPQAP